MALAHTPPQVCVFKSALWGKMKSKIVRIKISTTLRNKLKKSKNNKRDTYDDIIRSLIENYKQYQKKETIVPITLK